MADGVQRPVDVLVGESVTLANRVAPAAVPLPNGTERLIHSYDNRTRVIVNDAVVVEWLAAPRPAPYRGAVLLEHLSDVNFSETQQLLGVDEQRGVVNAVVVRHVHGARWGWAWFTDLLLGELEAGGPVRSVAEAARLGDLTARLHHALATPSPVLPITQSWGDTEPERRRAERYRRAVAGLGGRAAEVVGAAAAQLDAIIERLAAVTSIDVQPIHGDLHLGQMLRAGGRISVTGFIGGPVDEDETLAVARSPMADLANLVQSIDGIGRFVASRNPQFADGTAAFIAEATTAAIAGYRRESSVDAALLADLRVVQALRNVRDVGDRIMPDDRDLAVDALAELLAAPPPVA